jgi:hypothetical protein
VQKENPDETDGSDSDEDQPEQIPEARAARPPSIAGRQQRKSPRDSTPHNEDAFGNYPVRKRGSLRLFLVRNVRCVHGFDLPSGEIPLKTNRRKDEMLFLKLSRNHFWETFSLMGHWMLLQGKRRAAKGPDRSTSGPAVSLAFDVSLPVPSGGETLYIYKRSLPLYHKHVEL